MIPSTPELLRCPVCRARLDGNAPIEELCRRCHSDLSLPRLAYRHAVQAQLCARQALAARAPERALAAAMEAVQIVNSRPTRRTLAAALVLAGRTVEAGRVLRDEGGVVRVKVPGRSS